MVFKLAISTKTQKRTAIEQRERKVMKYNTPFCRNLCAILYYTWVPDLLNIASRLTHETMCIYSVWYPHSMHSFPGLAYLCFSQTPKRQERNWQNRQMLPLKAPGCERSFSAVIILPGKRMLLVIKVFRNRSAWFYKLGTRSVIKSYITSWDRTRRNTATGTCIIRAGLGESGNGDGP